MEDFFTEIWVLVFASGFIGSIAFLIFITVIEWRKKK